MLVNTPILDGYNTPFSIDIPFVNSCNTKLSFIPNYYESISIQKTISFFKQHQRTYRVIYKFTVFMSNGYRIKRFSFIFPL